MSMTDIRKADTGRVLRTVMCAFTAAFLIGALFAPDLKEIFTGLGRIIMRPAQLTKDYFKPELGSISGSMLNYFLVGAVCCALMFLPEAKVNGGTVLAFFLTLGFCSYGMNIVNILPLMLGVAVYSLIRKQPFGKNLNFFMFSTAIAPLITHVLFYYPVVGETPHLTLLGVVLALVIGVVFGCALPPLCAHSPGFHKGYDLYNAGPAAGFLCFLIFAVLHKTLGVEAPAITADLGEGNWTFVNVFCIVTFALCVVFGIVLNGGLKDYGKLFTDSGYKSDFTAKYSVGANVMNIGIYGLFIVLYYNLIGAKFTGPTMGAIFCMLCCCCNGATPLNVFPIMIGYVIMGLLNRAGVTAFAVNAQAIVVGLCFASGLAPISGEYGILAGIVGGILHYCLVTSVPAIHGGFNLYNGGFTAGIVCFLYVPILEHYFKSKKQRREAKA
ncbi:MAG: DUF1576 domain-containing protein [Clostridia bacterium]|nr:DUF1576 domain-containing protein [Clostridia bacterium]